MLSINNDASCLNHFEAEAWLERGQQLRASGERSEAKLCFRQVLCHQPDRQEAQLQLGMIAHEENDFETAEDFYRQVLSKQPELPEVQYNLALALRAQGQIKEAIQLLRSVIALAPDDCEAHSQFLLTLHYDPALSGEQICTEHQRWAALHTDNIPERFSFSLETKQRLKIGYLSANLRTHSVTYFLEAILENHSTEHFEVYCYAHCLSPDGTTERLQKKVEHWRFITDLDDSALADQIHADGIDILIDLTGHTANTRLSVLAHKPAPIQGTYLGYPNTTGMQQVDFRLTDPWADLPSQEAFYTEKLVRLEDGFLCYRPPDDAPEVSPPPVLENGIITFGSFNNLPKLNQQVVELWARILHAVSNSRLLIKSGALAGKRTRQHYEKLFAEHGIPAERLSLIGRIPAVEDHLALYSQVDIALDPFPYNGTTTTCEALWMGVPVITLNGQTHVSRVGNSLLSQLDLQDWIAEDEETYVDKAVALSQDLSWLQEQRKNLRGLTKRFLGNAQAFTQQLEKNYFYLWEALRLRSLEEHIQAGDASKQSGDLETAIQHYIAATNIDPLLAEVHSEIGFLLYHQGRVDQAIVSLNTSTSIKPECAETFLCLGFCYWAKQNIAKAIEAFNQVLQLNSNCAKAYNALGVILFKHTTNNHEEAIFCYQRAIEIEPNSSPYYNNLGITFSGLGRYTEAINCYQKSLTLDNTLPEAHSNLGNALLDQGRFQEAAMAFRMALQLKPDFLYNHSNLLRSLIYDPEISAQAVLSEHKNWTNQQANNIPAKHDGYPNLPDPKRRLKIGYFSPDLRRHSVAYFLEALLLNHDRREVEVICFAEVLKPDQKTEELRKITDDWHFTHGLSDQEFIQKVQENKIDIFVDLAGHTADHRLLVFAHKPAPIQITYLGYPATTGLSQIDYRLTDHWADPPDQEVFHTEKLVRIESGFLCYLPPDHAPEVESPPVFANNFITFGSFNNLPKINERVVALWSRILLAVPHSRLLLKSHSLGDIGTQERYYGLFTQNGIAPDRLIFYGPLLDNVKHLELYNQVDIALDPFPYNGTTTTCEALWMGVPVITLAGQNHVSRVGVSLLSQLNLQDFIATSKSEYVDLAVKLAENPEQLLDFRSSIRFWMAASSLCDGEAFARQLEDVYRQLWQEWCARG